MNPTVSIILSALTAFIIAAGGSLTVALVATKGAALDGNTWALAIAVGLISAAKDVRSLLKLPPVPDPGNTDRINKVPVWLLIGALAFTVPLSGCSFFGLKPVPVAAGQDVVVVSAERVQATSLTTFKELTEWEMQNRAALPLEVTKAVDEVRKEFPPMWRASRAALADYKAKRGPTLDGMSRVTAALSAAESQMLTLRTKDAADITGLFGALTRLADSIHALKR